MKKVKIETETHVFTIVKPKIYPFDEGVNHDNLIFVLMHPKDSTDYFTYLVPDAKLGKYLINIILGSLE